MIREPRFVFAFDLTLQGDLGLTMLHVRLCVSGFYRAITQFLDEIVTLLGRNERVFRGDKHKAGRKAAGDQVEGVVRRRDRAARRVGVQVERQSIVNQGLLVSRGQQ